MNKQDVIDERVEKGAKWLDEQDPEWFLKIDVSHLQLADSCRCVLGQLWKEAAIELEVAGYFMPDGYNYVARKGIPHGMQLGYEWAWQNGFNVTSWTTQAIEDGITYEDLDEAWIKVIKDRCNA